MSAFIDIPNQSSTPATPGSGRSRIYPKSDKRWYQVDDTGAESALLVVGKQTISIPSEAMLSASTNGATATQEETTTNKVNYRYMSFDPSTAQYVWARFATPKGWNAGTLSARFIWKHPSTATNFGVVWGIELLSLTDADALDTALGTIQKVTDTGGTTGAQYISPETSAITASNTPAKQDWMWARISRQAADVADTLAVNAHLLGVEIYYTTDTGNDA